MPDLIRMRTLALTLCVAGLGAVLAGCGPGLTAIGQTVQEVLPGRGQKEGEVRLDPRYRYLRVTVKGQPADVVLGTVEDGRGGAVEVFYSGGREALKFQAGRVVGASGLLTEWREVRMKGVPSWQDAAARTATWARQRDVMPGYHYGVQDRLTVRRIHAPRRTMLSRVDPAQLAWFEETMTTNVAEAALPPAIYGVDMRGQGEVVYGEQCVSREVCFTWQKWPVEAKK